MKIPVYTIDPGDPAKVDEYAGTLTSPTYTESKQDAEADFEAGLLDEVRSLCKVGHDRHTQQARLVIRNYYQQHRSMVFNRARKGVR